MQFNFLLIYFIFLLLLPLQTFGQNPIDFISNYCGESNIGNPNAISYCLQGLYNLGVAIAVVLAFFVFLFGAFKNLLSVVPDVKMEGKSMMKNAIIGLVVIFLSGAVLYWINPFIFDPRIVIYQVVRLEIESLTDTDIRNFPTNSKVGALIIITGRKEEIVSWRELFPSGLSNIIPENNDNGTEYVNRNLKDLLIKFNEELKNRDTTVILTDGYSRGDHQSKSHTLYGTAIDVVPTRRDDNEAWANIYEAAQDAGFAKIIYEAGPPIRLKNGTVINPRTFKYTTGRHFHLEAPFKIQ